MDFKDQIKQLAERVEKLKESIQTEEATKNAFIMPFIGALGYDVFNPLEVMPEFTCDIGTKRGEKIDYAIFKDGEPIILVECKHWAQDLNLHDNQLLRYFHVSKAKFGLLTNGIIYRFYTDLESPNKMDEKPFLDVNLSDLRGSQIEELKKFHKTSFDLNNILSSASELKYTGELKGVISREFANPSPDFVRLFARQVYDGQIKLGILEQFTELVRKSIASHISDVIADRLKSVLKTETAEVQQSTEEKATDRQGVVAENSIETTAEELEAFYIVKSILRSAIPLERVTFRDAQTYFAIFIDDNNRKPVCRFYFNSPTNKRLTFIDDNKKEQHNKISSLDDIYNYSTQLVTAVEKYL